MYLGRHIIPLLGYSICMCNSSSLYVEAFIGVMVSSSSPLLEAFISHHSHISVASHLYSLYSYKKSMRMDELYSTVTLPQNNIFMKEKNMVIILIFVKENSKITIHIRNVIPIQI
ncbi:hypothetical protein SAY87_016580 [Trapa incisa]|uniref:Uncharacterized protein n=1 Tax=Trapa incisa TaxID=236973 RepID=A0AAN7L9I0_9MYRT|nr:hypothetical protein SAY87_016580 [Trapa incisa]